MAEKRITGRAIQKHDIEANWLKATGFIPLRGEVIIYEADDEHDYERIKVGDGVTVVSELPFAVDAITAEDIEEILGSLDESDFAGIASPHMVRVTDAEGKAKWEERTHYTEFAETDILPEQNFTVDPDMGTVVLTNPLGLVMGETYTVQWNGVAFNTVAQAFGEDGMDLGIAIGNVDAANGVGDTGEPFLIAELFEEFVEAMGGIRAQILPVDGSTDFTVKITGKAEVVHPLNKKYFGDLRGQKIAEIDAATGVCSLPFDTVWAMDDGELQNAIVLKVSEDVSYAAYAVTKENNRVYGRTIQFLVSGFNDAGSPRASIYHWSEIMPFAAKFSNMDYLPNSSSDGDFLVFNGSRWGGANKQFAKEKLGLLYGFDDGDREGVEIKRYIDYVEKKFFLTMDNNENLVYGDVKNGVGGYDANAKTLATEEYVQTYIEETLLGGAW